MTTNRAPSKIIPRAFPGIKANEIEELIAFSKVRAYPPGSVLCRENAIEDRFYMILEGEVEVTKVINNAENRLLKTLGPGDFFGEMALLDEGQRTASVIALEPTRCLVIATWDFFKLLKSDAEMAVTILAEVSHRMRMALEARQQ